MIFGLTGKNAAGKGTAAEFLVACGFTYHSLSDVIREALAADGEAPTRERMIAMGNALRQRGGPGALAHAVLERLDHTHNHVVDSFRNPAEVVAFRTAGF